jgi:hypothetical protein
MAQSAPQLAAVSPHWGWHSPLPHTHDAGQSKLQVEKDSPHSG